jgi:hypothetical protein
LIAFLAGRSISAIDLELGCEGAESADHTENEHASNDTNNIFFKITSEILSKSLKSTFYVRYKNLYKQDGLR